MGIKIKWNGTNTSRPRHVMARGLPVLLACSKFAPVLWYRIALSVYTVSKEHPVSIFSIEVPRLSPWVWVTTFANCLFNLTKCLLNRLSRWRWRQKLLSKHLSPNTRLYNVTTHNTSIRRCLYCLKNLWDYVMIWRLKNRNIGMYRCGHYWATAR